VRDGAHGLGRGKDGLGSADSEAAEQSRTIHFSGQEAKPADRNDTPAWRHRVASVGVVIFYSVG
jgi:hypothetical protein